jgi:hypothetical protein
MNKLRSTTLLALAALATLAGTPARADNMASIAITPATGAVTLTPRWAIGGNLAGFHHMSQDLSLGGGANQFYSIKGGAIPAGGDIAAFTRYIAGSGAATNHADIGSKLTPNSYLALTSADPDIGYGAVNFYFIHRKTTGDYFTAIVPSSGTASAVTDLKPMSGPGGPATLGDTGYFGLTFAAANLGYGLNYFYYFRTDAVTGNTRFGTLDPALLGTAADKFDLGTSGHNALVFTGSDVGFGTDKMYYLRLDPITGFTILGTLHPVTGRSSDIANLGSVFSTLTFVPGDVGFGSGQFYTTGSINTTWQSVSFAAIADRAISAGSFTVTPSASSALPITLTVVSSSTGSASISGPVGGVFTVTPTAPGVITLQATQAGALAPTPYEYNMLRQSFTASGTATLAITAQPTSQSAVIGTTATFSVTASGTTAVTYQWRKGGANIAGNTSATTATLTLPNVQAGDAGTYDVVVTNASGSIPSTAVTLTATTAAPVVTNTPLTRAATVGTAFSFTITASGSPTSYSATPLPAGLSIVAATGVISGTPTAVGTTNVLLGATNGTGTGNATLTITVAAAGVAPIVTNSPLTAGGTVGTAFSFAITASGSPTSYTATPLPAGLSIAAATGVISGTPTAVGTTAVLLGATNATGTGNATLTITVAAAGVAPIVTNNPLAAAGTVGTAFNFAITASGSPTSYTAAPLPAGLSIVAATGVITGTPTAVGTTNVILGATNATGTGQATLTITVAAAGVAPVITNNPLAAAGTVGTPFSFSTTASGTPTTYSATPLPAGLSIVAATGAITGTPTAAGTTAVLLGATNGSGTGNATLTITVAAAGVAPDITNTALAVAGTVGSPLGFTITASGIPTTYAASPLPAGLSIVAATGAITGTPQSAGTTSVLLSATNAFGTGNATLTITVSTPQSAPVITNNSLAVAGTVGTPFSFAIAATDSASGYTASTLPAGLILNAQTGTITGTPTAVGVRTVLLGASNGTGTGNATLTITIAAAGVAPIITNTPLAAAGTVGTPFSFATVASGLPLSFTAAPLPAGLVLNRNTGVITGIATTPGTTNVLLGATNATGTGNATLTITVVAASVAPVITNTVLSAAGNVDSPFGFFITASGLPTTYTSSPLPAGLVLSAVTGSISGVPTAIGTTTVLLTALNSAGSDSVTLTVTVAAAGIEPIITNDPLAAAGTVGIPFGFAIAASGQPTGYAAAGLPAGLVLNPATGTISGIPTGARTSVVTLNATNTFGTANATLTITVGAENGIPIIANTPLAAAGTVGTPFGFTVIATGLPTRYAADGLPPGLAINGTTGIVSGTPTGPGVSIVTLNATNAIGTGNATITLTIAAGGGAPIIANTPLAAAGTVGTPFSFATVATGRPTRYAADGLPPGLAINNVTGVISGTPSFPGIAAVTLNATNATGTGAAVLTLTVAASGIPVVANTPLAAAGTVGRPFSFPIVATGLPTGYAADGLPTGLVVNGVTGLISGTPTAAGVSVVTLNANNAFGTGSGVLTVTVGAGGSAPIIANSPLAAAGTVGTPFGFAIVATGLPTGYAADGLPPGLTLNPLTGVISGTPTFAGASVVTLNATNASGTGSATLNVTVGAAGTVPAIANSPLAASGIVGRPFGFVIVATGLPTGYTAAGLPAGLALNSVTGVISGTPTATGTSTVTLNATNASGTGNAVLTITIVPVPVAPFITGPTAAAGTAGTPFATFLIAATGSPTSYSATGLPAGLVLDAQTGAITGTPLAAGTSLVTLTATNAVGSSTVVLTLVIAPAPSSRIVNFSARAISGPGNATLIMGFVVQGNGKNLLVRGIGPALAAFGVTTFVADPMLSLYNGAGAEIASNDDWQATAGPLLASTAARVGAFALAAGSKDAALLLTLGDGAHTTSMLRTASPAGVALTEIYDTDTSGTARLINVSARMNVTAGEGTLVAGLSISGNAPKTVLIRGIGPTLAVFGVTATLTDPKITVFAAANEIATNDNWETGTTPAAELAATSAQVGAFALAAGTRDAALLITLQPGSYTVHVTGVGNAAGVALVEVYDVR